MKRQPKIHYTDTRLYINAGVRLPACYASAKLLDMDKTHLPQTSRPIYGFVTCKRCLRVMRGRS